MNLNVQVFLVEQAKVEPLRLLLIEKGFNEKSSQALFCLKGSCVCCTMYESGKLVIQGKSNSLKEFIEFTLEPFLGNFSFSLGIINSENKISELNCIGTDEAGKGDIFGPLCVAAVHVTPSIESFLRKEGVRDSKQLSDSMIRKYSKIITQKCPHKILCLAPVTYNRLYEKFNNLNTLMGWAHSKVAEDLIKDNPAEKIIVDQFSKSKKLLERFFDRANLTSILEQKFRAENECVVAAASILARDSFLSWIETKSLQLHTIIPKGAGPPAQNKLHAIVNEMGKEILPDIAKMHFKPVQKAWHAN